MDTAEGAFLAVGCTIQGLAFGPLFELFVALLEVSTAYAIVPGGVATEAPVILTLGACDVHILLLKALEPTGKLVFCDPTAIGASFSAAVLSTFLQPKSLVLLPAFSGKMLEDFFPRKHSFLALWIWAEYVCFPFVVNVCAHNLLDAAPAHYF